MNLAVWLNRLILLLAFGGIFVAGSLSLSSLLGISLPCGASTGCDDVTSHASSKLFDIPISYFGLAAYFVIAGLAIWRSMTNSGPMNKRLLNIALALTGIGMMISLGLTWYAIAAIKAMCYWCFASAGIMTGLFIAHLVASEDQVAKDRVALPAAGVLLGVVVGIMMWQGRDLYERATAPPAELSAVKNTPYAELVPPDAAIKGRADAPITLVEFSDLACAMCRTMHEVIKHLVEENPERYRVVYRHLPLHELRGHEGSIPAAVLANMAGERGKFWEMVDDLYNLPDPARRIADLEPLLNKYGIAKEDLVARLTGPDKKHINRVMQDRRLAERLGVDQTPAYIVLEQGKEPKLATSFTLGEALGIKLIPPPQNKTLIR